MLSKWPPKTMFMMSNANMEMMTIPMILVIFCQQNLNCLFICMSCMRNYVQQETKNSFKSFYSFVMFMHFKTALQETQS